MVERVDKTKELNDLMSDRRVALAQAYNGLPDPEQYEGDVFRVPKGPHLISGSNVIKLRDYYEFVKVNGRWAVKETEYNRHIFEGVFI